LAGVKARSRCIIRLRIGSAVVVLGSVPDWQKGGSIKMDFEELTTPSLQANSLGKQIYEILKDQIIKGVLKPGERLVVSDLAAHLGVSVTPLRDALRRLSGDGWVEIVPRRGTFVSECTRETVREVFRARSACSSL
jgi:DNA-binding GntR family transcriptional regulator